MKRAVFAAILVLIAVFVACKSGEGEVCQVNADCSGGLTCNKAKNECQGENNMPLDALYPEALPIDAPDDAPHD